MKVKITNYHVFPDADRVDVELAIELPTGSVVVVVPVAENELKVRCDGGNWAEPELISIVSEFFRSLAETVTV